MLERSSLAVSRKSYPAAALYEGTEDIADAVERLHALKIIALVNLTLRFQDILPLLLLCVRQQKLQRLVAVEPGIEMKSIVVRAAAKTFKSVLQTLKVLRDAVHQRAFDIENES